MANKFLTNIELKAGLVDVNGNTGTSGQILSSTGSGVDWVSLSEISGVDGTGTANYVAKWSDTDTITNSVIYDNGTNVGIGTASPGFKLDLDHPTVAGTTLRIRNIAAKLEIESSSAGDASIYFLPNATGSQSAAFRVTNGYNFAFRNVTGAEYLTIKTASGNVGINTTAPTEKLAVTGNIETTETADGVKIGFNVGDSFTLNGANTAHYGLSCGSSTSVPLVLSGYHGVAIATNGLERARILHSNGNVGINTTNPAEKLEVVGNIKANNYINQRVAWNSSFTHTTGTNAWYYIPVGYIVENTIDTYYSNWIAAYGGRVRKIVLRGAGT